MIPLSFPDGSLAFYGLTPFSAPVFGPARTRDSVLIARERQAEAEMLALLGETDAAIAELRALHEMGWAFGYRLSLELEWEPLRGDVKFQQLMKEAEARADAQPRPKRLR